MAGVGAVLLTQTFEIDRSTPIAVAQALTPFGLPLMMVVAGVAVWRSWHAEGFVASVVGLGLLLLATPIVFPSAQREPAPDAEVWTAAAVNLLYENDRTDDIGSVLLARDPDVIMFSEYTPEHRTALLAHEIAEHYPHREERDGVLARGTAVWSKFPIDVGAPPRLVNHSIDLSVTTPDGPVRLLAVHPPTPVNDHRGWLRDLDRIGDLVETVDGPTLVIGDFNASFWHPVFRELLGRGLTDAHLALGDGWSTSWPTDGVVPAFVRLDHALVGNGLVATDVVDFDVPGSDHRGFVVSVASAR